MSKFCTLLALLSSLWLWGCDKDPSQVGTLRTLHHRTSSTGSVALKDLTSNRELQAIGTDAFGAIYQLPLSDQITEVALLEEGEERERYPLPVGPRELWVFGGSETVYSQAPVALPQSPEEIVIYFASPPEDAAGWGLHVWNQTTKEAWTRWEEPLALADGGIYGSYVRLVPSARGEYSAHPPALAEFPESLGLIVHKGDTKANAEDLILKPQAGPQLYFLGQGQNQLACTPDLKPCESEPTVKGAAAHWVGGYELLWKVKHREAARYVLLGSKEGGLEKAPLQQQLARSVISELVPQRGVSPYLASMPHLQGFTRFSLNENLDRQRLLKQQLIVAALSPKGRLLEATRVQIGGVLDEIFATEEALGLNLQGAKPKLSVWAPTAQDVSLKLYDAQQNFLQSYPMQEDKGVWSLALPLAWVQQRLYYRYEVKVFHPQTGVVERTEVTDPYSVSLARESRLSQLLNPTDPDLKPKAWDSWQAEYREPTDRVYYEVHVRDFSSLDRSVPQALRGRYGAFTLNGQEGRALSLGMRHLKTLQQAGLTHIQLQPVFDFASVKEGRDEALDLEDPFAKLCTPLVSETSSACTLGTGQTIAEALSAWPSESEERSFWLKEFGDVDAYNWGYDPWHYAVPEGSYAVEAEGAKRILEFREMIQALHETGLEVALDVVYNHSFASGLAPSSVLDRLVPGYYHRLDPITGAVEHSTCCENLASERSMMQRLMIDSLKFWVDTYKIDSFRFDLMGHHLVSNMKAIQKALGPRVYLYGEGWSFGEMAKGARGLEASQLGVRGLGIGTFNDRLRDAVRGGGPFASGRLLEQPGVLQGLGWSEQSSQEQKQEALHFQDLIRLGLLGTLAKAELRTADGPLHKGEELDYQGQAAGYVTQPSEVINYVENHDNLTLWDQNQLRLPLETSAQDRVSVQSLSLALSLLSAGVPYLEMGTEILRSKSLFRDAFNAGDWINGIDWTLETQNWRKALPESKAEDKQLLSKVAGQLPPASQAMMQESLKAFTKLLKLRQSSRLFRLRTAAEIHERMEFVPGTEAEPGVIVLRLLDDRCGQEDLDPNWRELLLVFQMRDKPFLLKDPGLLVEHPLWQGQVSKQGQALAIGPRRLAVLGLKQAATDPCSP